MAIKKVTALCPVSGEIYCNNRIGSGQCQGNYIWKCAKVVVIVSFLHRD